MIKQIAFDNKGRLHYTDGNGIYEIVNKQNMTTGKWAMGSSLVYLPPTKTRTKKEAPAAREVFDHWNSFKRKNWHSHPSLSTDISDAIKGVFAQGYTKEQINKAIDNYALVMFAPEYAVFNNGKLSWNKTWTLREFLTRSTSHDRKEKYMWRFLESNFRTDDFLTAKAKQRMIELRRQESKQKEEPEKLVTKEQKAQIRKELETKKGCPALE